jgi:hypothetical protein
VEAKALGTVAALWVFFTFSLQICNVDRSPVEDGTPNDTSMRQGQSASHGRAN